MATSRTLADPPLHTHRHQCVLATAILSVAMLFVPLTAAAQVRMTMTSLTVQPANQMANQPVTLTASVCVPITGCPPVTVGTVTFLSGTQVLGTVQVVGNNPAHGFVSGTATLKLGFPPGAYSLTARFNANNLYQGSQSGAQPLTVTGTELTMTFATAVPHYENTDFTIAAFGYGFSAPTGTGSLTEVSTGMNLGNVGLAGPGINFAVTQDQPTVGLGPSGIVSGDFNHDGCPDLAVANYFDNSVTILLGGYDGHVCTGNFTEAPVGSPYSVDSTPGAIVVGDFDADGNLDLAVACAGTNTIDVLYGNGDVNGTFQTPREQLTTDFATVVAVGDFNGQGLPDLVVAGGNFFLQNWNAGVFINNGNRSFTLGTTYPVGVQPNGIVVGDFKGDGKLDVAVVNQCANNDPTCDMEIPGTVSVLVGNGDGTFQQPTQSYDVGLSPQSGVTGDFNGDGCLDLAVTNQTDGTVGVLLGIKNVDGTCSGTFQQPQQTFSTLPAGSPTGIAVADFNGDGILDLAVSGFYSNTVSVFLGNGDGTFRPPQSGYLVGNQPVAIAVADLLGNGAPDMAVANQGGASGTVSVLADGTETLGQILNVPVPGQGQQQIQVAYSPNTNYYAGSHTDITVRGSGNWSPTTTTLTISPTPASAGQVVSLTATVVSNGEPVTGGTVTFLSGSQVLGTVQMTTSSGASTATLKTRFAPGVYSLTAQYNFNQLFLASQSAPQQLTVTGMEPSIITLSDVPDGTNFDFTASVFGNGFPAPTGQVQFNDLTSGLPLGSYMLTGQGVLTFQAQQTSGTGTKPQFLARGDFRDIGIVDLAVTNSLDNTVSVLKGNGDGTFQPQVTCPVGANPQGIVAADFKGNGILDLAVVNQTDSTIGVLLGDPTMPCGFQSQQLYDLGADVGPVGIVAGDFNGDGIADLAVTAGSSIDILLGNPNMPGTFQLPPIQVCCFFIAEGGLAVGDFNGDGILDLSVVMSGLGFPYDGVAIALGNGDGTFQTGTTYQVGASPLNVAVADFNGDHIPDLAVTNNGDGTVSILLGNGDGTFRPQPIVNVHANPNGITTADFNGDGMPDLAVTNDSDSTISVLLGNGDGTFQPEQIYSTGPFPVGVIAADLNGDGVPDLVAVNQNSSTVSILLGGTNTTAQLNNIPIMGSGNHMIQASYAPDGASIYASSLSNTVTVPAGGKLTPTLNLSASPNPVNFGSNLYFTATLQTTGGLTPTGTVTFAEGTTVLATANVDMNGQAYYTNNTLVLGQHTITATYNGDNNFNPASGTVKLKVNTPFTLTGDMNSGTVTPPQPATFTVTVDAAWQSTPLIYAVITCSAPAGLTCSVACPPSPSNPSGLGNLCVVTGLNQPASTMATVTVDTSGLARFSPPLHRGEQRMIAALVGFGGFGLVGLVFVPVKLRRTAVGGFLFLLLVVLCFGLGCTAFAPGSSSAPVNNTFNIKVTATLLEENPLASTGYNNLGLQVFWYELLIK